MTPNDIITWLRDKLPYAPDHAWKNVMSAAADKLEELEERRRFAAVQALLLADDKEQLEERVAQLEAELKAEMYRHDRLQDFEVAEAEELRKLKAQLAKDTNVLTNADRIRAMSDEELADMRVTYDPDTDMYIADNRHGYYDFVSAMEAELEWLRQPAEAAHE